MKKSFLFLFTIFLLVTSTIYADRGEIILGFGAINAVTTDPVILDMIVVKNLDQDCDTTILGLHPYLTLSWTSDIYDLNENSFRISDNFPNPFSGSTSFKLLLVSPQFVKIRLVDLQGKTLTELSGEYNAGNHAFKLSVATAGIYYAEISSAELTRTIKLVSQASNRETRNHIRYEGITSGESGLKKKQQNRGLLFKPGDQLEIIASAEDYPDKTMVVSPAENTDYIFEMEPVPIAEFTSNFTSGVFPMDINFIDQSTNNPTSWLWNFGDGQTSTQQNSWHTYEYPGEYTITLIATNEFGSNTIVKENYINIKNVEIYCDTSSGYVPLIVDFYGASNLLNITAWHWDFGDGETSDEQFPVPHIFMTDGTYFNVSLTVTRNGVDYTANKIIHTMNDISELNFEASVVNGWVPQQIQFTSYTNIDNPIAFQWSFGDGGTSEEENPSYTYGGIGTYTVILSVYDNNGYKTEKKEDYITIRFCPGVMQDDEGNMYETVGIGEDCWMKENLNMGEQVLAVFDDQTDNNVIEKFCYDNSSANCDEYGGLYQWDELMKYDTEDNIQGLCPDGWHISTRADWDRLIEANNGQYAAAYLRSTTGWFWGNAHNKSGFTALPGGRFWGNGDFERETKLASFYVSDPYGSVDAYWMDFMNNMGTIHAGNEIGFSARCVKDYTMKY